MTQRELADRIGMSKRMIGNYEAGRTKISDRVAAAVNLLVVETIPTKGKSKW